MSIAQKKYLENIVPKYLHASFDNKTVSDNIAFSYVEAFKRAINFKDIIRKHLSFQKGKNTTFKPVDIIDFMLDASILGYSRFSHMEDLKDDDTYKKIKQRIMPSEKVCRDLIEAMAKDNQETAIKTLRNINKDILAIMAKFQGPRNVIMNIDDTVCTIFGDQEGAEVGYNPRYKGRSSFKEKIAVLHASHEVIDLTLEGGKNNIQNGLIDFINSAKAMLPVKWNLTTVRIDSGAYSDKVLLSLEGQGLKYVIKCKKYEHIKCIIDTVAAHEHFSPWTKIDKMFSVNDIYATFPGDDVIRRFVVVRKSIPETKQLTIDDNMFKYEYYVIVTNIKDLTATEIFNDYNQRCCIETKIDELKEGFAFDSNSQRNKQCNELFLLIKMIAYNLHNFFRLSILPDNLKNCKISTVRRKLYKIAGNLIGNHPRYMHISLPSKLKSTIHYIVNALYTFAFRWRQLETY